MRQQSVLNAHLARQYHPSRIVGVSPHNERDGMSQCDSMPAGQQPLAFCMASSDASGSVVPRPSGCRMMWWLPLTRATFETGSL